MKFLTLLWGSVEWQSRFCFVSRKCCFSLLSVFIFFQFCCLDNCKRRKLGIQHAFFLFEDADENRLWVFLGYHRLCKTLDCFSALLLRYSERKFSIDPLIIFWETEGYFCAYFYYETFSFQFYRKLRKAGIGKYTCSKSFFPSFFQGWQTSFHLKSIFSEAYIWVSLKNPIEFLGYHRRRKAFWLPFDVEMQEETVLFMLFC